MTTATLPVLWLACGAIWKLSYVFLKSLAHASIAAPAAAAAIPPFADLPDPFRLTISPPASSHQNGSADDLPVPCPAALLKLCDLMANRGASLGRLGREFNAFTALAIPEAARVDGARDLALLTWAARLGYREAVEVKSGVWR